MTHVGGGPREVVSADLGLPPQPPPDRASSWIATCQPGALETLVTRPRPRATLATTHALWQRSQVRGGGSTIPCAVQADEYGST